MRLVSIASAAAIIVSSAFLFQGCSQQGEAMRCEVNDDCESGLTCTNVGFADKICCPDRARATTSECKNGATTTTDTGIDETPADTGTTTETSTDGSGDTAKTDTGTATETAAETSTPTDTGTAGDAIDAD